MRIMKCVEVCFSPVRDVDALRIVKCVAVYFSPVRDVDAMLVPSDALVPLGTIDVSPPVQWRENDALPLSESCRDD